MLAKYNYEKLKEGWDTDRIKECCKLEDPEVPGADCCYDTWQDELKDVSTKLSEACEEADLLKTELGIVTIRRDNLKKWYDELTTADELVMKICAQLEVILTHVHRINCNTKEAVEAIEILFCMIRDFFTRIDHIKTQYDSVINCLKCLESPILVPGQGIYKCLEDYYAKLQILIDCKAKVIKLIMAAIKMANRIDKNLGDVYGLHTILHNWQETLRCGHDHCEEEEETGEDMKTDSHKDNCKLRPMITLPIHHHRYYKEVEEQYKKDKEIADKLNKDLIEANKAKEKFIACEQSLKAAIKEVDPKLRCS